MALSFFTKRLCCQNGRFLQKMLGCEEVRQCLGMRIQKRLFWHAWVNKTFNRVDENRIKAVGPDMACAEWLLKCGAALKWKDIDEWQLPENYGLLPTTDYERYKIEEIDATNSGVMAFGFPYLVGIKHLKKIVFHQCIYLNDPSFDFLSYVESSLAYLQISQCEKITDKGLKHLVKLRNLKMLVISDLLGVKDHKGCYEILHSALPNCDIIYTDAGHGRKSGKESDSSGG